MRATLVKILSLSVTMLAFMAFISGLWYLYRYVIFWRECAVNELSWHDFIEFSGMYAYHWLCC